MMTFPHPLLAVSDLSGVQPGSSTPVAVLLHGYGSNERDLVPVSGALPASMPWVSLRAPINMPGGGAAWFEITTPGNPSAQAIAPATDAVWAWIDDNLPADARLVPIGFSQGGLMVSQLLRTRPERILASAVLSGFVQATPQPADATLASTRPPVFWGHADLDTVLAPAAVERTAAWLPQHSTVTEKVYVGLNHAISATELTDLGAFVAAQLGDR